MIVRQFLEWVQTAPAAERADASAAVARTYLHSDLSPDDRAAVEGALIMLLDDPSPLVRRALADTLAPSANAPAAVVLALAADQPEVAASVLERSPLLIDAELVDMVATGHPATQSAIANRAYLPCAVAAAIAEVGSAQACLVLIENEGAEIAPFSINRLVERFGHLAAIREALFAHSDLPAATHQALVAKLSTTLASFVTARDWLPAERANRIAKEACERATVTLAGETDVAEIKPLIVHLRESGQLTAGLILRALLSGNVALFEEALADLSGLPIERVCGLIHDRRGTGFRALYERAGLPASTYPAFHEALAAMHEIGFVGDADGAIQLKRRMVERVLTRCEQADLGDLAPLLMLLRRFAAEAAREEARAYCHDLVSGSMLGRMSPEERLVAA